jgi:hypothetical protein
MISHFPTLPCGVGAAHAWSASGNRQTRSGRLVAHELVAGGRGDRNGGGAGDDNGQDENAEGEFHTWLPLTQKALTISWFADTFMVVQFFY